VSDIDRLKIGTAYHEAGHAAVAVRLGYRLSEMALTIDYGSSGVGTWGYSKRQIENPVTYFGAVEYGDGGVARSEIMVAFAGDIAEELAGYSDTITDGLTDDREWAGELVGKMICEDHDSELAALDARTRELLADPVTWAGVERLASELVSITTIPGERVHQLLAELEPNPQGS
jgi:ATP-dependent Zn protease